MWRPSSVVPEHRKRATAVWVALLLGILGYTAWQIVTLNGKYNNPSTNFSVSDEEFEFPSLDICVWGGRGCDEELYSTDCVETAVFTVYDPCSNDVEGLKTESKGTNCVAFDLGSLDMEGFANDCGINVTVSKKPNAIVTMAWYTSYEPDEEDHFWDEVGIFLGTETIKPEYVYVPYTRLVAAPGVVPDDLAYIQTEITIGKNTRNTIEGDSVTSYPILTYSTGNYLDQYPEALTNNPNGDNSSYAIGFLHLTITQGEYSLTELTDIDPFDPAALLGNIGGFWEILLITWGLCFIASRSEAPTQRGRDFRQPIQIGADIVTRKRRRSSTSTANLAAEGFGEEQPYWHTSGNTSERSQQRASDGSFRVIPPVGSRPGTNVSASFFRHPVQQDLPRPSISASSAPRVTSDSSVRPAFSSASGPQVTSETSGATAADGESTSQHHQPPSYADCA